MTDRYENPTAAGLALPDELLLLALRESGSIQHKQAMDYALGAAALLELVLRERLTIDASRVTVLDATGIGHPACDEVLATIDRDAHARSLAYWIRKVRGKLYDPTAASLASHELVQRESGPLGTKRYPPLPNAVEPALAQRVATAMTTGSADDRTAIVAQLLQVADLLRLVVEQPMGERHARLKEFAARDYVLPGVTESVRQAQRQLRAMQAAAASGAV